MKQITDIEIWIDFMLTEIFRLNLSYALTILFSVCNRQYSSQLTPSEQNTHLALLPKHLKNRSSGVTQQRNEER